MYYRYYTDNSVNVNCNRVKITVIQCEKNKIMIFTIQV
jgi:hypothetical protein